MKFNTADLKSFAKKCFNKHGREQIENMKYSITRSMHDMVKVKEKQDDHDKQEEER